MRNYAVIGSVLVVTIITLSLLLWDFSKTPPPEAPAASEAGRACYQQILDIQAELTQAHRQLQTIRTEQEMQDEELANLSAVADLNNTLINRLQTSSPDQ